MEKEIISAMVASIDSNDRDDRNHKDSEVWRETDENGARFELTRRVFNNPDGDELEQVFMTIVGSRSQRIKVIGDFCSVLGDPQSITLEAGHGNCRESVNWFVVNEAQF